MPTFQYAAETHDGQPMRGTLDCADLDTAQRQLTAIGLRVLELSPAAQPAAPPRLGPADLQAFNEYLLQISTAGLPAEQGLKALSSELGSSKLKRAIDALVADLERGTPIEQALAEHRTSFPPLYAKLLDAGIQSANLPAVLQRFGRHMETVAELRDALWRACAYPLVVIAALLGLTSFLGYFVLPQYIAVIAATQSMNRDLRLDSDAAMNAVPLFTVITLHVGRAIPYVAIALAALLIGFVLLWALLRAGGRERGLIDSVLLRLPLVGPALRANYVASWLEVVAIGTSAGLDLPRAATLAGDAVALPSLSRDSAALAAQVGRGAPIAAGTYARLPATVPLAIDLAQASSNLPQTLLALADQFQTQARRRIRAIPGIVMPALLLVTGLCAGGILYSLWMPLANMLRIMFYF